MDEIECTKCGVKSTLKDPKNPVFSCDSCRRYFCEDCLKLSKLFEKKILEEIRKTYETLEKELSKKFFEELEKFQISGSN